MIERIFFSVMFIVLFSNFLFPDDNPIYKYGIFISSSKGYNENKLPNALKEVEAVAWLFKEYCRIDEIEILEDPDKSTLDTAFEKAKEIIAKQNNSGETRFFLYYYGHGLTNGLLLNQELYRKEFLKEKLSAIDAKLKFIFLDACSSQILGKDEKLDFSTKSQGTVFITSSTQYQKSYAGIFTPILKAGLMGDADGFIPQQMDTLFFYNEITAKLNNEDKEMIQSLYGINEYYHYQEKSVDNRIKIEKLFTALGVEPVPENIHITALQTDILDKVNNIFDKEIIMTSYHYNQICTLKKELSAAEKDRLLQILEKAGVKKDKYVTLTELFFYIQNRIAGKKIIEQTPTINTSYLSLTDPVRLSYIDNKVALILAYPGTIFVKKVIDRHHLENIIQLIPRLDDNASTYLNLPPGQYKIFVETDNAQYTVDIELKPGDNPRMLEKLDWSTLTAYQEDGKWQEKTAIDKKLKMFKTASWVSPLIGFSAFAIPLSLLFTGVYYNYTANNLYATYTATAYPQEAENIREQINEYSQVRNNLYIAAGACFAIPVIPLIIWIVMLQQGKMFRNKIDTIKNQFILSYYPEISIQRNNFCIAFHIKIKLSPI